MNNYYARQNPNSINFITKNVKNIIRKLGMEIMVALIILSLIFYVSSLSSILYYWYFYTYTPCILDITFDIKKQDASKDKSNFISYKTEDGRSFAKEIPTDDKNVKFIYVNNVDPNEFITSQNHPALGLVQIILFCISSIVLLMLMIGTFQLWGIYFYIIMMVTNTICVFSYITSIMTRFKIGSNWTYILEEENNKRTTKTFDQLKDIDLKNDSIFYSYDTVNGNNVITDVSENQYDNSKYNLYYDTRNIKNYIIVSKTSFPPYFMPLIVTLVLIFVFFSMCTLFLFI